MEVQTVPPPWLALRGVCLSCFVALRTLWIVVLFFLSFHLFCFFFFQFIYLFTFLVSSFLHLLRFPAAAAPCCAAPFVFCCICSSLHFKLFSFLRCLLICLLFVFFLFLSFIYFLNPNLSSRCSVANSAPLPFKFWVLGFRV